MCNPVTGKFDFQEYQIRRNVTNPRVGRFGYTRTRNGVRVRHDGVDILVHQDESIYSAAAGRVSFTGQSGGYGNVVIIDHGNGLTTRYAHLSTISVRRGDQVDAGQVIGTAGITGNAANMPPEEEHVHFEVRQNNVPQDPLNYLVNPTWRLPSSPYAAYPTE